MTITCSKSQVKPYIKYFENILYNSLYIFVKRVILNM
nr:MAG TPA: Insulin receptor [Caudoviricetes sp.]